MQLVPRQLARSGMTGNVPYYGGRFTPAQAYGASHPQWQPATTGWTPSPDTGGPAARAPLPAQPRPSAPARSREESLDALQHLLDSGVITQDEYDDLHTRMAS